jgi:metallo-beta-lactamase family protein
MNITFLGAAREVTGSCYLVETAELRFLVDCGMHQGPEGAARNRQPFAFDPRAIDLVLLTHAHIDHSGLLPKLALAGYTGPIYTTDATADLLAVMLPDSGHLQEADSEREERHRNKQSTHAGNGVAPLYTVRDAEGCLELLHPVAYDTVLQVRPHVSVRFRDAGHILGSSIIETWVGEGAHQTKLVFSGDLGQPHRPILRDPTLIDDADYLLVESTYGNRKHRDLAATLDELVDVVNRTLHQKQGNVIIPAFAVGRTQEILYYFNQLTRQKRLRPVRIFVDSPMATAATRITLQHLALFDEEAKRLAASRELPGETPSVRFVASVTESKALNHIRSGAVIISASGMCEGGRIRHHLRHNLGNERNSVLFTGFQAQGTLGRRLVEGDKRVRLFEEEMPVKAEIHTLGGLSAHADQPALLAWLRGFKHPPERTFIVHGEEHSALAFAENASAGLGFNVSVPRLGQTVPLAAPANSRRTRGPAAC